jgi:DNA polymerase-3 subunit alpha
MAGAVISRKDRRTRDDKTMAHIGFSDASGMFEAVAFSEALAQAGALLEPGKSVLLQVASRWDGDDLKLQIHSARPLADAAAEASAGLKIYIDDEGALASLAERLKDKKGRGVVTLILPVDNGAREVEMELPGRYAVTPSLRGAIKQIKGVLEAEEL